NEFASFDRDFTWLEVNIQDKGFLLVLQFGNYSIYLIVKPFTVCIDRSIAIGMGYVHSLAVSCGGYSNTNYITVVNRGDWKTSSLIRCKINTSMEVTRADFPETAANCRWVT